MNIGAVTTASVSSAVWTVATRNLTALGFVTSELISQVDNTLAASASLDVRPAAGKLREIFVGIDAATNPMNANVYDGSLIRRAFQSPAAATSAAGLLTGNSVVGPQLQNTDGAAVAHYMWGGIDWS